MRALIVEDGLSRQALSASRALAGAGWTVGVGAQLRWGLAATSRATHRRHAVPAPQTDPDAFVDAVNRAVWEEGYEIVFGARDVDVLALSTRRDDIGALVPYPSHDRLMRTLDKLTLTEAAERAGLAVPHTTPATEEGLARLAEPIVVKARLHATFDSGEAPPRLDTRLVATRADASRRAAEIRSLGGEPLLQEFVGGKLVAFIVLADQESRLVAKVQQEAERVWPIDSGVSVRAQTVPLDDRLTQKVAALVADLGWAGLAELQFVVPPDGEPRLIDFNGRFYGSLALAVGAGANLPALWASMATGRATDAGRVAVPGVRYQWLFGDLRLCLDEGGRGRLRRALGSLRYARGAVQSVFNPRDPLPALRHLSLVAGRSLRKALP